ncbi:MAG: hypothetical protein V3S21_07450 [Xanthomonadales bacterium]
MTHKIKLLVPTMLLSLIAIVPVQAAEEENDGIAQVILITPKAGQEEALVKAITDYHHWVADKQGHSTYNWYEILTGPDTGKYIARSGGHNWSDFDAEYDWQEEAGQLFKTNVAPHIESAQRTVTKDMDDFSHWPENFEGYTHFQVEDWYVKGGQYGNFRKGLKKITDALKSANFGSYFGFSSVESGGRGNKITLVSPKKGWSGMKSSDPSFLDIMTKTLGGEEEFNNFMSEWGATFKIGHNRMVRFMPGASDYNND